MREIKFRGKRLGYHDDVWVYGYPVKSVNDRTYIIGYATEDAINTTNEVDFLYHEVNPETIGQYIGLNDSKRTKEFPKGEEIYNKGSICTFKYYTELDFLRVHIAELKWNEDFCTYVFTTAMGNTYTLSEVEEIEVIGNIFDNPELLKETNDGNH